MIRSSILLLAICLLAGTARGDEADVEGRAFVEILAPSRPVYVGEPVRLGLRIGFDRAWFDAHAVPLFRRSMDVPVQVEAPWLREPAGLVLLAPTADERQCFATRRTFVLNGEAGVGIETGDVERDGRTLTVLEVGGRYLPDGPGTQRFAAPKLRFSHATLFEEDFVGGRVPVDRQDALLEGTPLELEVRRPPAKGRPPVYVDAVGRFNVRASISARGGAGGVGPRLTLVIEGAGNLASLTPPQTIQGFHVYGVIDDRGSERRTVTYEIAAKDADVAVIPAIPFAFFDPGPPAAYRVVKTQPIPLEGHAAAGFEPAPSPEGADEERSPAAIFLLVASVLLVAILGVFTIAWRQRRLERLADEAERAPSRRECATAALRAHVASDDSDPTDVFAEFLAAHLDLAPASVIGAALETRLEAAGVPAELAARAAATMTSLVETRYANGTAREPRSPLHESMIDELTAAFEPTEVHDVE